jgi:5'-3' exonuclease
MKIIAFDVSGIFWQAALGGAGKDDINAPYMITTGAIQKLSDGFDRVAIAVDAPRSFRQDLHAPYKSNRPERVEWQWEQLRRVLEWCKRAGYVLFEASGFEADDVMMTVAAWCAARNYHCAIVSNDKDMASALGVGPDVLLVKKNAKNGQWETRNAEQFTAAHGFAPVRMPDFLALAGDAADGFSFFEHIGDGTAAKLVQAYSDLGAIYNAAHDSEHKWLVKLQERQLASLRGKPEVYDLALKIATPVAAVPIDCALLEASPVSNEPPPEAPSEIVDAVPTNRAIAESAARVAASERAPSTALARLTHDPRFELAPYSMQPDNLNDAWRLAKLTVDAAIMPQWGRPEQAAMVIMAGRERRIPAFVALQNMHVVKGRVGCSAALLAAMIVGDPDCEYFELDTDPMWTNTKQATVVSKKRSRPKEQRLTYTLEEAKQAGLVKSHIDRNGEESCQWIKRPATMLRWAAFREAARSFWPHITTGMYTPAELRERFDAADMEIETAGEVTNA